MKRTADWSLSYQMEKFDRARREFNGSALSRRRAVFFFACEARSLGLHEFDETRLDDESAHEWIATIKCMLERIKDLRQIPLTFDEKLTFANAVDELAHYFAMEVYGVR